MSIDLEGKAGIVTGGGHGIGLTRTLARELGDDNISVNALAPGSTLSEKPQNEKALEHRKKALAKRCLKRLQFPEDLVGVVVFLCSDASDFMTGQTLVVDGGGMMI
ncbi:SDR family NAD(P)-dependent oxidoreductase [Thermodesulfobacteriota bacterium]